MTTAPNTTGHNATRDLGECSITPRMSRACHVIHGLFASLASHGLLRVHFATLSTPSQPTICAVNNPLSPFAAGPPVRAPQVTRSRFARADPDEPTATSERQDGGSPLQQLRPR